MGRRALRTGDLVTFRRGHRGFSTCLWRFHTGNDGEDVLTTEVELGVLLGKVMAEWSTNFGFSAKALVLDSKTGFVGWCDLKSLVRAE